MTTKDGQTARRPYRVRVAGIWYWVDPTVPASSIEPGDTVLIYPVGGEASLAILQSPFTSPTHKPANAQPTKFSTIQGQCFELPASDIASLHLAAVDDEQ